MLAQSHFIATTVMVTTLGLEGSEILVAYTFGNLIDLDHLFYPDFMKLLFSGQLKKASQHDTGAHTLIHEPFFAVLLFPLCLFIGSFVPLIFWGIHLFLDHVIIKAIKRPLSPFLNKKMRYGLFTSGTRTEWITSSILAVVAFFYLLQYLRL